ncbi:MAG: hypothetical protein ACR2IE_01520 [Candidatus Sumerlaeaceae bacterium]
MALLRNCTSDLRKSAQINGAPAFGEFGVYGVPGKPFSIKWQTTINRGEQPVLKIWSPRPAQVPVTATFRTGGKQQVVPVPPSTAGAFIKPSPEFPAASANGQLAEIEIRSTVPEAATSPVLVLDKININARGFGKGFLEANAWTVFPAMFLPWLLFVIAQVNHVPQRTAMALAVCTAILLGIAGTLWKPAFAVGGMVYATGTTLLWLYVSFSSNWREKNVEAATVDRQRLRTQFSALICIALLSVVLAVRWKELSNIADVPLLPDALHYFQLAIAMHHPLDTLPREPLHMMLLRTFLAVTSWSAIAARTYTLFLSLLLGAGLYLLTLRFVSIPAAAVALLLYAFNPVLVQSAPQGLREELFPLLIMLLLLNLFNLVRNPKPVTVHAASGLAGAAIVLTRISGICVFPLLYGATLIGQWRKSRPSVTSVATACAAFMVPIFFMLTYAGIVKGDPFISSTIVTKFYAYQEFAGKPGFPSRLELERDSFTGPAVTTGEYLFKYHSIGEVADSITHGLYRMLFGDVARKSLMRIGTNAPKDKALAEVPPLLHEHLLYVFYILGFFLSLRTFEGRLVVMAVLAMQLPLAFLAGRDLLHPRLMMNATPFMLLLSVIGGHEIVRWTKRFVSQLSPAEASPVQYRSKRKPRGA